MKEKIILLFRLVAGIIFIVVLFLFLIAAFGTEKVFLALKEGPKENPIGIS